MAPASVWMARLLASWVLIYKIRAQDPQCELPESWTLQPWFVQYSSGQILTEAFTSESRKVAVNGVTSEESFCEQSFTVEDEDFDTGATIKYNTIAAFKILDSSPQERYCHDGIQRGDILMYQATEAVKRTVGYTVEQCEDNLGASSWNTLIKNQVTGNKFTFTTNAFENPIKAGSYKFSFKNGDDVEECEGGGAEFTVTSSTIKTTVPANCFSGTATYEKPLNIELRIVGVITDEELDVDSTSPRSGMCVLAYEDSSAPQGYYFYIARYEVVDDDVTGVQRLELLYTTNNKDKPTGYLGQRFIPPDIRNQKDSILFFYAESSECDKSPCKNNGTCIQKWTAYLCVCSEGYAGDDCEEDENECNLAISPCNNQGTCEDDVNTFTCDCFDGWGGDRCEYRDPCNPNPCKAGGSCSPIDDKTFICLCTDGNFGQTCQISDACADMTCANGGTCVSGDTDGGNGYYCVCPSGWSGDKCEMPFQPPTGKPGGGAVCITDDHCMNGGGCFLGRCMCEGFWTGAVCQTVSTWFIVSIALIVLLVVLLIVILIICCCCCYGNAAEQEPANVYTTMEAKSLDGLTGASPAPGNVQFNVRPPPTNSFDNVLTSVR